MYNTTLEDWLPNHLSQNPPVSPPQMCFMIAWTDLWFAWPSLLHVHTAARCARSLPCVFLAVIQLNLSSYPTLLKRQIPDATCSHPRQLMCSVCLHEWPQSVWDSTAKAQATRRNEHTTTPMCLTLISACLQRDTWFPSKHKWQLV